MVGIEIQVEMGLNNSIEHVPFKKSQSSDDSIYTTSFQCALNQ
jgi:hypothetical protein